MGFLLLFLIGCIAKWCNAAMLMIFGVVSFVEHRVRWLELLLHVEKFALRDFTFLAGLERSMKKF